MSNTFTSAGTYYVSLTVTDDDGATDTATVEVGEGWETQHTFADSHTSSNTAVITAEDEVYVRTVNGNYTATITSSDKDEMDQIAADAANELSLTTGSQGSSDTVQIGSAGTTTAISDSNFVHGSTEVGGLLPGWVPGDVDLFEHSFADWHDGGLAEVVVSAAAIAAPAASSEVFTEFTLEGDTSTELDVQYSGRWEVHINAILGGTDSDVGVFVRDVTNSENGQGDLGD